MKKKILEILKDITNGCLEFNKEDYDVDLIEKELLDSFSIMEMIVSLEEKFKIELDGSEITEENFKSINAITMLVNGKLNGGMK